MAFVILPNRSGCSTRAEVGEENHRHFGSGLLYRLHSIFFAVLLRSCQQELFITTLLLHFFKCKSNTCVYALGKNDFKP